MPSLIADGVTATYAGMMIALPPDWWQRYDQLPATTLGQIVRMLAVHVDPRSERRRRRDNRLSAKSQALLRAATLERLMHDDGDDPAANVFSLRTIAMATRDFSSNPSKALRHAGEALVMVTKQPADRAARVDRRLEPAARRSARDELHAAVVRCGGGTAGRACGRVGRVVSGLARRPVYASRPPARRLQLMSRRTQMTDVHAKLPLP